MADIEELKKDKPELWAKFSSLDGDFSGGLDKDELWCQARPHSSDCGLALPLTPASAAQLSKTPGVTEEFADQMISMIDTNGDGVIDFNECAQLCFSQPRA